MAGVAVNARSRVGAGVALILVCLTVTGVGATTAEARDSPTTPMSTHVGAPPSRSVADGLPRALCALLKKPVISGVNYIIRVLSKGRIKGSLAGNIFSVVGFQPWCMGQYGALRTRLEGVVAQQPTLRSQLGPFVFRVHASAAPSRIYANSEFFSVNWSEYPRPTILDRYELFYSVNDGRYIQHYRDNGLHFRHGYRVRFAVRVIDVVGVSSPWVYSPQYYT